MGLLENIVEFAYFFFGSVSIGYFFLRIGWPNSRAKEKTLKVGWSIVFGAVFSIFIGTATFIENFAGINYGFGEMFIANALFGIGIAITVLSLKRKFFTGKKIRVIIPKEIVHARIAAEKAMTRLENESFFVSAKIDAGKLAAIKKALEEKQKAIEQPLETKKQENPASERKFSDITILSGETMQEKEENDAGKKLAETKQLLDNAVEEETTAAEQQKEENSFEEKNAEETIPEKETPEENIEGKDSLEFMEEIHEFEDEKENTGQEKMEEIEPLEDVSMEENTQENETAVAAQEKTENTETAEAPEEKYSTEKLKEMISEKMAGRKKSVTDEIDKKAEDEWIDESKKELLALKELAKKQKILKIKEEIKKTLKAKKKKK